MNSIIRAWGFNNDEEYRRWYAKRFMRFPPISPSPAGWEKGVGLEGPFREMYLRLTADLESFNPPMSLLGIYSEEMLNRLRPRAKKAIIYGWLRCRQELYKTGVLTLEEALGEGTGNEDKIPF